MADEKANSKLIITDGDLKVNLFDLNMLDWVPNTAPWKDGGVFSSSMYFGDRENLVERQFTNTSDVFTLAPSALEQDTVIRDLENLITLLEKAVSYQLSRWQGTPVWIEARGEQETNIRYATIVAYQCPQLDNPNATPFAATGEVAIDEFTLNITHEIWASDPPGAGGHCVAMNTKSLRDLVGQNGEFYYPESDNDTLHFQSNFTADIVAPGVGGQITLGNYQQAKHGAILVFRNVDVPRYSRVSTAHISVNCTTASGAANVLIYVTALKKIEDYNLVSKYNAEEIGRLPRTTAGVAVTLAGAWVHLTSYDITGLAPIIQEIVNDPDWEAGMDIAFVFDDNGTVYGAGSLKFFASFLSGGGHSIPILHVDSFRDNIQAMGQDTDTCEEHNFVTNMHHRQQLTHVEIYDASVPGWVNRTLDFPSTPIPFRLFPNTPAANDICYVGIQVSAGATYSGPFSSVIFDLLMDTVADLPPTINAMTYEYYDSVGLAWTAFPAGTYYSELNMFNRPGVVGFYFMPPPTWGTVAVNGVTGWWIRFVIGGVDGGVAAVSPYQQNRYPYTINTPYVDIPASSSGGDIPALAKTIFTAKQRSLNYTYNGFYLAVRSVSRGIDFSPYLNFADTNHPQSGLTCTISAAGTTLIACPATMVTLTPTGRIGAYAPPGAVSPREEVFRFEFPDYLAQQYSGRYAVYFRYWQSAGAAGDFSVGLRMTWGGMVAYTTPLLVVPNTENTLYMGTIDLTQVISDKERFTYQYLSLDATALLGAGILYCVDLVLVPVDEFTILLNPEHYQADSVLGRFEVSSLDYPKDLVRVFQKSSAQDMFYRYLDYYMAGAWLQQTGHQRMWYFMLGVPSAHTNQSFHKPGSIQQWASSRYALGMRGEG